MIGIGSDTASDENPAAFIARPTQPDVTAYACSYPVSIIFCPSKCERPVYWNDVA